MPSEIIKGFFPKSEPDTIPESDRGEIDRMISSIRKKECNWCMWGDYLVMGTYDDDDLDLIVIARVVEEIQEGT